jgi:hypothetical protein
MTRAPVTIDFRSDIDSPVEALLRELIAEVKGLRADLARTSGRRRPEIPDALLPILAQAVFDKAFTATEVIRHASTVDAPLRAALDGAGLSNARQLGKWFRAIEGRVIVGARLTRIGTERDGVVWRVRVCESLAQPAEPLA